MRIGCMGLAVLVGMASSATAQQCPADLATALKITLVTGDAYRRDIVRNTDGTTDVTRKMPAQREPSTTRLFRGLLPIEVKGERAGTIAYETDLATLFPLKPGDKHTLPYKATASTGAESAATMTFEVRAREDVKIGDCTFETFVVSRTVRFASGQRTPTFIEFYAPSVGFVVRAAMVLSDGTINSNANETFERLEVVQ